MKATGIVRRIDDLGRVVIPKEIRRTLRIKEGTPLEIFTDREGEIILKKYSPIGELSIFAKEYTEALSQTTGLISCIADHDQIVATSGSGSRELQGKEISQELEALIGGREAKCSKFGEKGHIQVVKEQKNEAHLSWNGCCRGMARHFLQLHSLPQRTGAWRKGYPHAFAGYRGRRAPARPAL